MPMVELFSNVKDFLKLHTTKISPLLSVLLPLGGILHYSYLHKKLSMFI